MKYSWGHSMAPHNNPVKKAPLLFSTRDEDIDT